jgi:hypothetical protein
MIPNEIRPAVDRSIFSFKVFFKFKELQRTFYDRRCKKANGKTLKQKSTTDSQIKSTTLFQILRDESIFIDDLDLELGSLILVLR